MPNFYDAVHCTSMAHCSTCRDYIVGRQFRGSLKTSFSDLTSDDFECPKHKPWTVAGDPVPTNPTDRQKLYLAFAAQLQDIMLKAKMGSCGCNKTALAQRIKAKLEYYRNTYYGNGGCDEETAKKI